jgi:protoheme IX farnesyltransferase
MLESAPANKPQSGAVDASMTREQALTRLAISDYVMLTKPRIISLLLIITLLPMFLAGEAAPSGWLILWTMIGGFLAAGGANAVNQYVDRDIDHVMVRTRKRPLPGGRLSPTQVLVFGIVLCVASFVLLWWQVNLLTAILALGGFLFYVFIYTGLLKRTSTQNIVIGGAAGAVPPLVGWAAVANEIALLPLIMFLIVFYWTPPHFWALALMRQKEYKAAGVPMLPVVAGDRETYMQIVLYSVILLLFSVLPVFLRLLGPVYLVLALILNGVFLYQAVAILRNPSNANVWRLYKYSLLFLALLFVAMGVDHLFYTIPPDAINFRWTLPF